MTTPNTPADKNPLARTPRRGGPRKDHLHTQTRTARFLDPTSAVRFDGQQLDTTAYAGDQLLLRPTKDNNYVLGKLEEAAGLEGYDVKPDSVDSKLLKVARDAGIPFEDAQVLVVRIHLSRRHDGQPVPAPDAWPVLQRFRELMGDDPRRQLVQLEHLLTTAAPEVEPAAFEPLAAGLDPYVAHPYVAHPYVAHAYVAHPYVAHPYVAHGPWDPYALGLPSATAEYAQPGWGGRMPVTWVGPKPARRRDSELGAARRPVVAILDTGTGNHPWLTDDVVDREPTCADLRIGLTDAASDIERKGVVTGQLTGSLDIEAGHGTFIAGLVHQRCPDARILSIRVVQPDGVVNEYDVLQALNMLWLRQELALRSPERDQQIDVISMSLGYYHEQPADELFDQLMLAPLRALSRQGVAVVVSAGNDATSRPMYPAAFSPYPGGVNKAFSLEEVPLIAVGATNPDGSIALFSNDGPWVHAYRPGAGLVSTMPKPFDGGQKASIEVSIDGHHRATIDPDNFLSGFATWSGTSFAAPILAGDLAQCLNKGRRLKMDRAVDENPVRAAWQALRDAEPGIAGIAGIKDIKESY
jgi:hypothetical protein